MWILLTFYIILSSHASAQPPVKALTDSLYLAQRMQDFEPGKAGDSRKIQPGVVNSKESEET
ncbi:MAG TPA: hypothetical protein PKA85_07895, partial [Ferruginibacter sp.]|nr:hypothetical protein [Ferruginibacter sp.]